MLNAHNEEEWTEGTIEVWDERKDGGRFFLTKCQEAGAFHMQKKAFLAVNMKEERAKNGGFLVRALLFSNGFSASSSSIRPTEDAGLCRATPTPGS